MLSQLTETFELRFKATRRQAQFAAWTMLVALLVILVSAGGFLISL